MRSTGSRLMRWINVGIVLLTLLSYLSPVTNPNAFWPTAFLGLVYPLLLLANVCCILWWAYRQQWYALFSVACIVMGWANFQGAFGLRLGGFDTHNDAQNALTVMTFNAHEFKGVGHKKFDEKLFFELIKTYQPAVLCFQEFTIDGAIAKRYAEKLAEAAGLKYSYQERRGTLALFSRYPIGRKDANYFTNKANGYLFADIDVNGKSVRIFNLHLQTNAISRITESIDPAEVNLQDREIWHSAGGVLRRYKRSSEVRARQAIAIADAIKKSPNPVVVCGDFNDVPMSFSSHTISEGLQDAFRCAGGGRGVTYAGNIPGLRIDYILADPAFEIDDFKTIRGELSDHYPLVARLNL